MVEAPDDFTELDVVPTLADILSNQACESLLGRNITNGAYNNVDHYLDVQFRLLREDFLQSLRDGVHKLREIVREARLSKDQNQLLLTKQVKSKISKIQSVYFDCLLDGPLVTDRGIVYQVRLSTEKARTMNWDLSKKLLFGSLLCLSDDYFENTCLVATICDRGMLKQGAVMAKLDKNENQQQQIQSVVLIHNARDVGIF